MDLFKKFIDGRTSWKETRDYLHITERLDKDLRSALDALVILEELGMKVLKFKNKHMYVEITRGSKLDNRKKVKGIAKALNLTIEVKVKEL